MKIKIREFKDSDSNFVISTWIKSYYSNCTGYREGSAEFYKGMKAIISKKYDQKQLLCLVACLDEDEDHILGFGTFGTDYVIHYVYTKETYKRLGVCKLILNYILKARKEVTVSHWTKDLSYLRKHYSITYNRFKFFN